MAHCDRPVLFLTLLLLCPSLCSSCAPPVQARALREIRSRDPAFDMVTFLRNLKQDVRTLIQVGAGCCCRRCCRYCAAAAATATVLLPLPLLLCCRWLLLLPPPLLLLPNRCHTCAA